MGVTASDRFESEICRLIQSFVGNVFVEHPVEEPPLLGVLGDVDIRQAKGNTDAVEEFECGLEESVPRHETVELVAVYDEEPTLDLPAVCEMNAAGIVEPEVAIVITVHPDDGAFVRLFDEPLQHVAVFGDERRHRLVDDVAVENELRAVRQTVEPGEEAVVGKVLVAEMKIADDECEWRRNAIHAQWSSEILVYYMGA